MILLCVNGCYKWYQGQVATLWPYWETKEQECVCCVQRGILLIWRGVGSAQSSRPTVVTSLIPIDGANREVWAQLGEEHQNPTSILLETIQQLKEESMTLGMRVEMRSKGREVKMCWKESICRDQKGIKIKTKKNIITPPPLGSIRNRK